MRRSLVPRRRVRSVTRRRNRAPHRERNSDQAIFRATLAVLAESGVAGLTIDAVAARARIGRATIYRRWPSKLPLIADALASLPPRRVPDTGTLRDDLRFLADDLIAIMQASPLGQVIPYLLSEGRWEPHLSDTMGRFLAGFRETWVLIARRAIGRGELPPGTDPRAFSELIAGPITNRFFFSHNPLDETFVEYVISTVVAGAQSPAQQRRRTAAAPPKAGRGPRGRPVSQRDSG